MSLKAPGTTVVSAAAVRGQSYTTYVYVDYDGAVYRARGASATSTKIQNAQRAARVCAVDDGFYILGADGRRVFWTAGDADTLKDVSASFKALSGSAGTIEFMACGPLDGLKTGVLTLSSGGMLEVFES